MPPGVKGQTGELRAGQSERWMQRRRGFYGRQESLGAKTAALITEEAATDVFSSKI